MKSRNSLPADNPDSSPVPGSVTGNPAGVHPKAETLRILHEDGSYPYAEPLATHDYEHTKKQLQAELMKVQDWVRESGQRIVVVFEGRDAAGKGGTIKRFMEHLNPRLARVVALEKPTDNERGQWYFQRYVRRLPTRGEMIFFDRSWYNRAGVERVMGFCDESEYTEFLEHCPRLERMLTDSGITLFKYWFSVSPIEQVRRFKARESDPLKQWKLSPIDRAALTKWEEYTEAKLAMFRHTDTPHAPWVVIKSDDKKRARINCLRHFLHSLDYPNKDPELACEPDDRIVIPAADYYGSS
ncbi:polyphosphate kinase 2 [Haloferula helveola]|uniref:ADP/GDP-polyphosphate phosphotransferase n=1 Tax=Haloferula helveola TaxID=490095 RepID=A0ABM7R7M2_9BACT|nr:polyphosphate kinase 2 [Haloferula helveola]